MESPKGSPVAAPLDGIRVIDFTQAVAGPYATRLLAQLGADVVKIERPEGGDVARRWSPICPGDGRPHSALFSVLNANKRSVAIDFKQPGGFDLCRRLLAGADLVFENFRPGVLDRAGLGYSVLRQLNPGSVLVSISNYGQRGTFRDYRATELNLFAYGGRMAAAGTRPRPPVRLLAGSSLFTAGSVAAGTALIARRGGRGDHLDISIANVLLGQPDRGFNLYSYSGVNMERPDGPRPFQTFPAADGFVVLAVNRGIERIAQMIGRPEVASDPRFTSNVARQQNATELEGVIIEWTVVRTKSEIISECQKYRVIGAPVATIPEVIENSHLGARRFFRSVVGGRCICESKRAGPPFRITTADGWGWRKEKRAPELGEHTIAVLQELGLDNVQIEQLLHQQAIGCYREPVGGHG